MLKKEKKRAQDAAAQLANITNCQSLTSQSASRLSTLPVLRDGGTDIISEDHRGRAIQYMNKGTLKGFFLSLQRNGKNNISNI